MNWLQLRVDHVPCDLVVSRSLSHGLLRSLVVCDNASHHTNSLGERALEVIVDETVLLQEILTNDLCNLKRALLILREGVLSDKLHNLLQIVLLLQNLLHLLLQESVLRIKFLEERLEDTDVLREGDVPVH